MTTASIENLLYRPMQCHQALEDRGYHGGVILKRAVEMNAHQSPRIVKQGSANRFNFARSFLNLKFDVRIPWLYSHNQSPALVKFNHSMIINPARTTCHRWRTRPHQLIRLPAKHASAACEPPSARTLTGASSSSMASVPAPISSAPGWKGAGPGHRARRDRHGAPDAAAGDRGRRRDDRAGLSAQPAGQGRGHCRAADGGTMGAPGVMLPGLHRTAWLACLHAQRAVRTSP